MQPLLFGLCIAAFVHFCVASVRRPKRPKQIPAHGERVLLVGCSSGIGRELALQYAARGASLILVARRKSLLESLQEECARAGAARIAILAGDVASRDFSLPDSEMQQGLDTVVYCAGAISVRPFMDACGYRVQKLEGGRLQVVAMEQDGAHGDGNDVDEAMQRITNINYTAAVRLTRKVLPVLLSTSKAPNLILVSSLAGRVGAPTRALYAGSKHAVHGFFDSLRVELASYGMHVGIICPATVDTDLRASAVDGHLGHGPAAGSSKGKLSASAVATRIITASDLQEREVFVPASTGYLAIIAKMVAPSWVDWAASKKYQT